MNKQAVLNILTLRNIFNTSQERLQSVPYSLFLLAVNRMILFLH